mmetsp:Transcript_60200/g.152648  ORF Transcript_60200/g.152648 Transcript_60200/m.152648 type:complete len:448 (-) Transcript_60200:72-1415(-)
MTNLFSVLALLAAAGTYEARALSTKEGSAVDASSSSMTFEEYMELHGRTYSPDSAEFHRRKALFELAVEQVERQNTDPDRFWTAALNHLADRTPEELAALRGYDRGARPEAGSSSMRRDVQFVGKGARTRNLEELPEDFTWKSKLQATKKARDQRSCGSCWAFASSTVLRAHSELFQSDRMCSVEQIVSCTANPQHCGGDGGCTGATAELAMDYVARKGCVTSDDWVYTSKEVAKKCPAAEAKSTRNTQLKPRTGSFLSSSPVTNVEAAGLSFGLKGYTKLPENQLAPVLSAIVESGPVAVSISSGRGWNLYSSGIYNGCVKDAIIDHAVTLVGFGVGKTGRETGKKYWQLQNSWGPSWGESGYIRISRRDNEDEARFCGMDNQPLIGSGCKGGPPKVRVCGTCGILYDAVVPDFKLGPNGLWSNEQFLLDYHKTMGGKVQNASAYF